MVLRQLAIARDFEKKSDIVPVQLPLRGLWIYVYIHGLMAHGLFEFGGDLNYGDETARASTNKKTKSKDEKKNVNQRKLDH